MSYEWKEIEGWLDPPAARWLYEKASTMDSVLEVGSWKGRSAHPLASGCSGPVFCVDHWKGSIGEHDDVHREAVERYIYDDFCVNMAEFRNVVPVRMDSVAASRFFADKSIDMIYIDGGHLYDEVFSDLSAWFPKHKKLFCGHDYEQARVEEISDILKIRTRKIGLCSVWEAY